MIKPTRNNRVTSSFGYRTEPYKGFHQGIDFGAIKPGFSGDNIFATESGNVKIARWQTNRRGFGRYIVIEHDGYCTLYAHLNGFNVKRGQSVSKGQTIGYMGTSGSSTGVHLHYGVFNCLFKHFFTRGVNGFKYPIKPVFEELKINYKALYEAYQVKIEAVKRIIN